MFTMHRGMATLQGCVLDHVMFRIWLIHRSLLQDPTISADTSHLTQLEQLLVSTLGRLTALWHTW